MGYFADWPVRYLIITIRVFNFSDKRSISFTLRCNMMQCDTMYEMYTYNTFSDKKFCFISSSFSSTKFWRKQKPAYGSTRYSSYQQKYKKGREKEK
ncbi:hypothetical protein CsSME_00031799 [Camellia sinensis var. sinensis]